MDLSIYAPDDFKEHLKVLDDKVKFSKARRDNGLDSGSCRQHYVLTGNEGVGKSDAAREIYQRLSEISGIDDYEESDAASLFEPVTGFNMSNLSQKNTLIHIKNAEQLSMRGNNATKNGIEDLCDAMSRMKNCIVVLSGRRSALLGLVRGNEKAKALFSFVFHFDDLVPDVLCQYMQEYANEKNYLFDPSAEDALKSYIGAAYKQRGMSFRNKYFLQEVFDNEIVPRMSARIVGQDKPVEDADLCVIMPEDLPEVKVPDTEEAIRKLEALVGLDDVKKQILDHTALVKLNSLRASKGLYNRMPPMHMVFTGNPGTGKTTIAKHIGEIYHSIGVLSSGHVVETERSKLIGEFIGSAEKNAMDAIRSASGGVLFIDEAYSLFVRDNERDYGMRVIETLLTQLSSDDTDMIVILAGYTSEMKSMLEANPGMKSRFPYIFHFSDYTPDQLIQIGKKVLEQEHYTLTPEAEKKLAKYVIYECDHKDKHFGNGRFITRLITSRIIPSLSRRLLTKPSGDITVEEMSTIEACDIPEVAPHGYQLKDVDETVLSEALDSLDKLIGLQNAKHAMHDFAAISRLRHQQGTLKVTPQSLCWDFVGKTGTGKSTVAEILGKILQGLGILSRGHIVSVNADELTGEDCYGVLSRAVKDAENGLLFLDMDSPNDKNIAIRHLRMWVLNRLRETEQTTAVVIGQIKASEDMIVQNLADNGIASYSNSIVFNDFTPDELSDILATLLHREYTLDISPDAKDWMKNYIGSIKASESKESPVNARTVSHLAQTIAHIAQLRIARSAGDSCVCLDDVDHFKWSGKVQGKVGFIR
jgi:SpoVK/Ycf46/Vps4 family AAA+-type ATPase